MNVRLLLCVLFIWLFCGWLAMGLLFPTVNRDPENAYMSCGARQGMAFAPALFGPFALYGALAISGFGEQGLQWRCARFAGGGQ